VDGEDKVAITFDPLHVLFFIKHDFMPMNAMCDRGQMSERGICDRSKAVFEHFGLPFDAEPPVPDSSVAPRTAPGHPKVGRNDPCPCGSGKKYKKCHGKG
jgi:SEC-C motif